MALLFAHAHARVAYGVMRRFSGALGHEARARVIKIGWSSFKLLKLNEMHWIITHRSYFCVQK